MIKKICLWLALLTGAAGATTTVGHWVDISCALQTEMVSGNTVGSAQFAIDSCVVYGTAGTAGGTDLRLGKATGKSRPGRKTGEVADSLKPLWKFLVNYDGTNFPGAYGMGISATFYTHVVGDTTSKFEMPGILTIGTKVATADTINSILTAERTWIASKTDTVLTAQHGTGSWTTGSGGLDSAGISRIIGRKVWGIAAGVGADSSTASVRGTNIKLIDDATGPAPNLEEVFDNDGTGAKMELTQLKIVAPNTLDTGIVVYGADAGPAVALVGSGDGAGLRLQAGATGAGLSIKGGSTSGAGIADTSISGDGATFIGGTAGHGIQAKGGATNGAGIKATGQGTAGGLQATAAVWPAITGGVDSLSGIRQGTQDAIAATDYAYFTNGTNEDQFKANVSGLATTAATASLANQQVHMAMDGIVVAGYCDSITQAYLPAGSANKDQVIFTKWLGGVGTVIGNWYFRHSIDVSIADTVRVKP
jgi:hypothetical protein